jgi:hypothetical protein
LNFEILKSFKISSTDSASGEIKRVADGEIKWMGGSSFEINEVKGIGSLNFEILKSFETTSTDSASGGIRSVADDG